MSSTTVAACHPGFTGSEPITWEKIGGLFSELFRLKMECKDLPRDQSTRADAGGSEWRSELSELGTQWRAREIHLLFESLPTMYPPEFVEAVKDRVFYLREMLKEEEGPGADLSPDSLRAFLAFLHQVPGVKRPNLALTPEGGVYAQWKGNKGRLFAAHFLSGDTVRFTAFRPNPRHPSLVQRVSGIDAVDTVIRTADAACSILEWLRP